MPAPPRTALVRAAVAALVVAALGAGGVYWLTTTSTPAAPTPPAPVADLMRTARTVFPETDGSVVHTVVELRAGNPLRLPVDLPDGPAYSLQAVCVGDGGRVPITVRGVAGPVGCDRAGDGVRMSAPYSGGEVVLELADGDLAVVGVQVAG